MAYNDSDRQIQLASARDVALKLQQEKQLIPALKKHFDKIARDFAFIYAAHGRVVNTANYTQELHNILGIHYTTVANLFKEQIRDKLGEPNENAGEVNDAINSDIVNVGLFNIPKSVDHIHTTTQNNINDSLKKTMVEAAAAGLILTTRQVAKRAKAKFTDLSNNRLDGISMTETALPAEAAKQAEVNNLVKFGAVLGVVNMLTAKKKKHWVTILDSRTRLWHAQADGQTKSYNQPYIVHMEKLMHPRDSSLGASAENIINCRCTSIITIIPIGGKAIVMIDEKVFLAANEPKLICRIEIG